MSATVCWTTFCQPKTMVNVGTDALAMRCDNIVCFINLKTYTKLYFKADHHIMNATVSILAGHNRFPLFAFSDKTMRPNIHVLRYPDFKPLDSFLVSNCFRVLDVRFSESDHLIAFGGHPDYKIFVWNVRTSQLLLQQATNVRCSTYSIMCTGQNNLLIAQYSMFTHQIHFWQLSYSGERHVLQDIARMNMPVTHSVSESFSVCFGDDGILYIVDDYGIVSSMELANFNLNYQWAWPGDTNDKPRQFRIYSSRIGLMVHDVDSDSVYSLRKKPNQWVVEWTIKESPDSVVKLISNVNNEIFGACPMGNLMSAEVDPETKTAKWVEANKHHKTNFAVLEYSFLRGIKEELIILLSTDGELRLYEIFRMFLFSTISAPNGLVMVTHNTLPYVAVGAVGGLVYFYSYEKYRMPVLVGQLELKDCGEITDIRMADQSTMIRDDRNRFHIVITDLRQSVFTQFFSTVPEEADEVRILDYILVDTTRAVVFAHVIGEEVPMTSFADELWLYNWADGIADGVHRSEFELANKYSHFSLGSLGGRQTIELFGIVHGTEFIFDILNLMHNNQLVVSMSIRTHHLGYLKGVIAGRNVCTWSTGRICYHFKTHKRSPKSYVISRFLDKSAADGLVKRAQDCFNAKFLVLFVAPGFLKVLRLPPLSDQLMENTILSESTEYVPSDRVVMKAVEGSKVVIIEEPTAAEYQMREKLLERLEALSGAVTELIDYDISVTGKTKGIFRKFCLHDKWLNILYSEARTLCEMERNSLERSCEDHARIRDWIRALITRDTAKMSLKVRALFSNTVFENYSLQKPSKELKELLDLYRFYDMEPIGDDDSVGGDEDDEEDEKAGRVSAVKQRKRFVIRGSAYEHVMADDFTLQDKNNVSVNQMHNDICKLKLILNNALMLEFNKIFADVQKFKQEIMDSIIGTNSVLLKIYDNMNIMLRLLEMDQFTPAELSVPVLMKDEVLERIMEVDDSEIKAINRRKKKQEISQHKGGRMLLWAIEFWIRALNVMMDGVLEKLWEEEIKKDVPIPEFILKKNVHEYSLDEQRQFREYEEKVRLLAEDRRKYLRILNDNEHKAHAQKKSYILKLNERCAELSVLKLKYDFAIGLGRMRLLNLKVKQFLRKKYRKEMIKYRNDSTLATEYIGKYSRLLELYERSVVEIKEKLDTYTTRDKTLDRHFKGQYLTLIPATMVQEMSKLYRRRPKIPAKCFNSTLMCMQVAGRLLQKQQRAELPLPNEVLDYLKALEALDDHQNIPHQMDTKYWDIFVRLRRQKIEAELRIRATNLHLNETQNTFNNFNKYITNLRTTRLDMDTHLETLRQKYGHAIYDQNLQITLTMGQVEVKYGGTISNLRNSVLMHLDDINAVNDLIKKTGMMKLKAMQKVARFRRKVIFREWEHKVVHANIIYLKRMLFVIEKCKISMEFLDVIRNWQKLKERQQPHVGVGFIERIIEEKVFRARRVVEQLNRKIDAIKMKTQQIKSKNQLLNKQIEEVKVDLAMNSVYRDYLIEEKYSRELREKMNKIMAHRNLVDKVRRDYAHILELSTLLELQRLRTYPTLGPAPPECEE